MPEPDYHRALEVVVHGREAILSQRRQVVLSCRPMPGVVGTRHTRPAQYWTADALTLAERLMTS